MIKQAVIFLIILSCSRIHLAPKIEKLDHNFPIKGKLSLMDITRHQGKLGILLLTRDETCPISNRQTPYIEELKRVAKAKNIAVYEVFPTLPQDKSLMNSDVIIDKDGEIARSLKFSVTTEAVLLNKKLEIIYRGAINDKFTLAANLIRNENRYVFNALTALHQGKKQRIKRTKSIGCELNLPKRKYIMTKLTYHNNIKNIIEKKCLICHRSKNAYIPLRNYKDIKAKLPMIRYVLDNKIMPPWYADNKHRKYKYDFSLSKNERLQLLNWIDGNAPLGKKKKASILEKKEKKSYDYEIIVPKISNLPAKRTTRTFDLKVDLKNPKGFWVTEYNFKVSHPRAMHHITMYADQVHKKGFFKEKSQYLSPNIYISTGISSDRKHYIPKDHGFYVPKNAKLFFSVHIEPTGQEFKNSLVKIKLKTNLTAPKYQIITSYHYKINFKIPANSKHKISHHWKVPENLNLISVSPHMHLTGDRNVIKKQNGEIIYRDTDFYYKFTNTYYFEAPEKLLANEVLILENYFNNTKNNPWNPDPSIPKYEGTYVTDEMAMFVLHYSKKIK